MDEVMLGSAFEVLDLAVSGTVNVASAYVVAIMAYWWWKLRSSPTCLRPLILGIAISKVAIWFLSFLWIVQILSGDYELPFITFPARFGMMVAVLLHMWVVLRIGPDLESGP